MSLFGGNRRGRDAHEKNMEVCADALMTAIDTHQRAVAAAAYDHARILNVAVFALIWNADLSVLLEDVRAFDRLSGSAAGWKRKLTARLLALTIVEAAEEFTSLLGREFRASVKRLSGDAVLAQLNAVHKNLSQFREEHAPGLRTIRNTIIAHRDPDAAAQVDALRALNVKETERLGLELLKWTNSLHDFVGSVMASHSAQARRSSPGAI